MENAISLGFAVPRMPASHASFGSVRIMGLLPCRTTAWQPWCLLSHAVHEPLRGQLPPPFQEATPA